MIDHRGGDLFARDVRTWVFTNSRAIILGCDEAVVVALNRSQAVAAFRADGTILHANGNFLDLMGYRLAGESSRGFAVVAASVKALALQSAKLAT